MAKNYIKSKIARRAGKIDKPRFVRCLAIYRQLIHVPNHIEILAKEYEVSVRCIQRDLNALTQAGYPVMPGHDKGWYKMEGVK